MTSNKDNFNESKGTGAIGSILFMVIVAVVMWLAARFFGY